MNVIGDPHATDPPATVLLVRHGETAWNRDHRFQGQQNPPLTTRGHEQARRLAARLAHVRIDVCLTSDLHRAKVTAEALCAGRAGLMPREDSALREVGMGAWEGLTRDEVERAHPQLWARWCARPDWNLPPGGEGPRRIRERARRLLDALAGLSPGSTAVVVSHGGLLQTVLAELVGGSSAGHHPFDLGNTSITTLQRRGRSWWIAAVNDTHHLGDPAPGLHPAT